MTKIEMRAWLRSRTEVEEGEDEATVRRLASLLSPRILFAFLPLGDEPDITPLFSLFPTALPVTGSGGEMAFRMIGKGTRWKMTALGTKEPADGTIAVPGKGDVILVPGLGFTPGGSRIGRGKGFYDRYLSLHREAVAIGVCRRARIVEAIETDPWDQRVDHVVAGGLLDGELLLHSGKE